jgi:hypothetical protein
LPELGAVFGAEPAGDAIRSSPGIVLIRGGKRAGSVLARGKPGTVSERGGAEIGLAVCGAESGLSCGGFGPRPAADGSLRGGAGGRGTGNPRSVLERDGRTAGVFAFDFVLGGGDSVIVRSGTGARGPRGFPGGGSREDPIFVHHRKAC